MHSLKKFPNTSNDISKEYGFKVKGLEPTRFNDWERRGRCTDFWILFYLSEINHILYWMIDINYILSNQEQVSDDDCIIRRNALKAKKDDKLN